jgi:hypothetical protein
MRKFEFVARDAENKAVIFLSFSDRKAKQHCRRKGLELMGEVVRRTIQEDGIHEAIDFRKP